MATSLQGARTLTGRPSTTPGAWKPAARCICRVASATQPSSGRSSPDLQQQQQRPLEASAPHNSSSSRRSRRAHAPSAGKYERILAFVNSQATPTVADGWSSGGSSDEQLLDASAWHHSYDEEAEEGEELLHEPQLLLACAAPASTQPAGPIAAAAAAAAAAAFAHVEVPVAAAAAAWGGYGSATTPKPFFYSWDEEAEGAYDLATVGCSSSSSDAPVAAAATAAAPSAADVAAAATMAARRAERRAAMHEARHAARMSRRMRRSTLHPQLGDLEHMPAWLSPKEQQQQRSAAGARYAQLLAFVAGDAAHGQYRQPKHWHLTFDEDVHGPEAPETVLGSC